MSNQSVIGEVSGKRVHVMYGGGLVSQLFGSTTFTLYEDRLVEDSKGVVLKDHTQVPIDAITGVNICTHGNPLLLVIGFATLPVFGLGILFLILYFFMCKNFLVVSSEGHIYALQRKGDDAKYNDFAEALMGMAIKARASGGGGGGIPAARKSSSSMSALAAPQSAVGPGKLTVNCGGCGAEYSMPAGSAGKKFRCQQCRTVVEVP